MSEPPNHTGLPVYGSTAPTVSVRTRSGVFALQPGRLRQDLPDLSGYVVVDAPNERRLPRLDGRALQPLGNGNFIGEVLLVGDAAYHEITAYQRGDRTPLAFAFCTQRASRRLPLIREMMEFVPGLAQLPEHLFPFGALGSENERVPGVVLGWMTERLSQLMSCLAAITARPTMPLQFSQMKSPFGRRVAVNATRRLIREDRRVLQRRTPGLITIAERQYTPEFVIELHAQQQRDTHEHRQIKKFIQILLAEIASLRSTGRLGSYKGQIEEHERDLRSMMAKPPWRPTQIVRDRSVLRIAKTPLQHQDRRYSTAFDILHEYLHLRSFEPADDDFRTILEGAPRLFQVFAAYVLADALNLTPVGRTIVHRVNKASFIGDDASLYYDVHPPASVLRSWRDGSLLPDRGRPDIVIVSRSRGVLVLDAKFKDYGDDGDLNSDVREMQVYHDAFGITRSGILTPFSKPLTVEGRARRIRVIPIRPVPFDRTDQLRAHVLASVSDLFCTAQASG